MQLLTRLLFILTVVFGLLTACEKKDDPRPANAPTANAGPDQTVGIGSIVTLDGTASTDSILTYQWSFASRPSGSSASLGSANTATPTFTPDQAGNYVVKLIVTNAAGSDEDQVTITADPNAVTFPIRVDASITTNTTWSKVAPPGQVDYLVTRLISVGAALTVEEGVRVAFASNAGIQVNANGSLKAVGTASQKITFAGQQSVRGFWVGIRFLSNNPSNELTHVVIRHGGGGGFDGAGEKSNLEVDDQGRLKLTNAELSDADGPALRLRDPRVNLEGFAGNVFTNSVVPVNAAAIHYHFFDAASDFTGNDDDYIFSYNSTNPSKNVTWQALNVPYRLAQAIEVIEGAVTIQPGARFLGSSNAGIQVSINGSLKAVGTASQKITFVGEQDARGAWLGIRILSSNPSNELTHVVIRNGGGGGFDGAGQKSNLEVDDQGRLKLTNAELSDADGPALRLRDPRVNLEGFAGNVFTNSVVPVNAAAIHYHFFDAASDFTGNDDDYIFSYNSTNPSKNVTWQALNVPYRLAQAIEVIEGAVTVRPGARFLGAPNAGLQVGTNGSLNAVGTSGSPITFLGEQNIAGFWRGLQFLSNNVKNVLTNVEVANGGSSGFDGANRKANIELDLSGRLNITNSTIRTSDGWGIYVDSGTLTQSGNSFNNNKSGNVNK